MEWDLPVLHFWNYSGEGVDADDIDFTYFGGSGTFVGSLLDAAPALGGGGSNPIFAEDIPLAFPARIQFVHAILSGSKGQVDLNNMGFTHTKSDPSHLGQSPNPLR